MFVFCTECRVGTYGQDCQERCECENSAGCDPVLGDCICTPGWDGRRCDQGWYAAATIRKIKHGISEN